MLPGFSAKASFELVDVEKGHEIIFYQNN